jgi:hypothetical protein
MTARIRVALLTVACATLLAGPAMAQQPNFSPAIYADGQVWGTKATTVLPGPRGNNLLSYDKLFVIVNGAPGQLPVAEAAPGNRLYNGGRWFTHTVMWTAAGIEAHESLPVLMSYDDLSLHYSLGHLAIAPGSPAGGPPDFFQCPLLPVK